jgi:hypothetical protein
MKSIDLANKPYIRFMIIPIFLFVAIISFSGQVASANGVTTRQPAESSLRLSVSDVGTWKNTKSLSTLYVPAGNTKGQVVISDIVNQINGGGRISYFAVKNINSVGACTTAIVERFGPIDSGTAATTRTINFDNNGSPSSTNTQYRQYCVDVRTSTSMNDPGGCNGPDSCFSMNINFILSTPNLLGNYSGVDAAGQGTGYFQDLTSVSKDVKWQINLDFAPPCGWVHDNFQPMEIYDLDTINSSGGIVGVNSGIRIQVQEADKGANNWGSIGMNVAAPSGVDTYPGNSYFPKVKTGETATATPTSGWGKEKRYRLFVSGVGENNKIRILLAFDQLAASVTCPPPDTGAISCSIASIIFQSANVARVNVDITSTTGVPPGSVGGGVHIGVSSVGDPSTWASAGVPSPAPDYQNNYIGANSGLSGLSHYTEDAGGFTYNRYYIKSIHAPGKFSVSFDVDVKDNSRDVVVRFLKRSFPASWHTSKCSASVKDLASAPACTLKNNDLKSLTWTSTNATKISIDNGIGVLTNTESGTVNRTLSPYTKYTATVTGSGGPKTCNTTTGSPPPAPDISCPSYSPYVSFSNPNVVVDLTAKDTDKPADSYSAASGGETIDFGTWSTNKAGTYRSREQKQRATVVYTYYRYITTQPQPKTEVDSVISAITSSSPVNVNVKFDDVSDSDGTAELDYTDLAKNYPYDPATPVVTYRVRYEVRERDQYVYRSRTQAQARKSSKDSWGAPSYPSGGFPPWPTSGDNYGATRAVSFGWTGRLTTNAKLLPPCYPRYYDATPGISGVTLTRGTAFNREDPDSSTVTFTIPATLSFKNGGNLRTATTVTGLDYRVDWYAQGYSDPGFKGTYSGKANIANTSITSTTGSSGTLTQKTQSFTIPNDLEAGDQVCFTVTVLQAIGRVKVGGERWLPGNTPRTTDVTCSPTIVDLPYTRFYGADISAGGGFNTNAGLGTCSDVNPDARAFGPMRGGDIFAGSGAQLAVFAMNEIEGIQPLSRSERTPTQLAFSNKTTPTPNIDSRQFGGDFGSRLCAHDYFGDAPENTPENTTWTTATDDVDLAEPLIHDTVRHYIKGNVNLTGQLPDGKRVVIYVDGNVTIKDPVGGKVGFATSTYEWGSIDLVPSLSIIARGNINVNNDVTRLDGSFISQGGVINSCTVDGAFPSPKQRTEQCRTQLVVNGAFIGSKISLLRTFGSLRDGVSLEAPSATKAAETFMYNPTLWFIKGGSLPSTSKIQIDSYTSLPPSL